MDDIEDVSLLSNSNIYKNSNLSSNSDNSISNGRIDGLDRNSRERVKDWKRNHNTNNNNNLHHRNNLNSSFDEDSDLKTFSNNAGHVHHGRSREPRRDDHIPVERIKTIAFFFYCIS